MVIRIIKPRISIERNHEKKDESKTTNLWFSFVVACSEFRFCRFVQQRCKRQGKILPNIIHGFGTTVINVSGIVRVAMIHGRCRVQNNKEKC